MKTQLSLTEGPISRSSLTFAIWLSFPPASLTSLVMVSADHRFGGGRASRMGVKDAAPAPAANA